MFDLISQSMLFLLQSLKGVVGNYGLAIIVLTVLVRAVLWPVSRSQMLSMRMMQELQPRMKMLQDRHKADPQKLQAEMMKLYKDYKFNPLGGCLPMLVQLPLFIGLYWAISNPHFLAAGDQTFLGFIHLNHTGILSHGGQSNDGKMSLNAAGSGGMLFGIGADKLIAGNTMTIVLNNGTTLDRKIPHPQKTLDGMPKQLQAGVPETLTTNYDLLDLKGYEGMVKTLQMPVINTATKELETVTFIPTDKSPNLQTTLQTVPAKDILHIDVLLLLLIFAGAMFLSQKQMTAQTSSTANDQQQQMMKFMPLMFSAFLFIFPIPAGVLLYMDTNSLFQIFQTWMFQRSHSSKNTPPSQNVLEITPDAS